MPDLNPEILRWARDTAGLSLEEAASKLGIDDARGVSGPERLAALETGEKQPSRPLLLKMAKQYRRPLLTFYLPAPPRMGERGQDFRSLPPEHSRRDDALVDTLVRDVRARQGMVRALLEAEDEAQPLSFVGSMAMSDGVPAVLASIVGSLGLDRAQFRHGLPHDRRAKKGFPYLREKAERVGVYVLLIGNLGSHHSSFDLESFRGFALADPVAPFIVINDQDAETAWSFTLLHELAHIWLGQTGVSGAAPTTELEQFCNDVAGNFLLPSDEIAREKALGVASFDEVVRRIGEIAQAHHVSHSLVAYKLLRGNIITRDMWSQVSRFYRQRWLTSRSGPKDQKSDSRPDYYVVRRHRIGPRLLSLARRMLADGAIAPSKAGRILGVRPGNVYALVNDTGRSPSVGARS